jgi:hypothetical protein
MAVTTITKTTNLIKIKTNNTSSLEKCYSLTSGYKFAPKHSGSDTDLVTDAIIFTIGGESFDMICANGITIGATNYVTLATAYPALITYLT